MGNKYLPLFRKYRPQSFKDVIGQEALVKALTNAIELNRTANAYLFCGPRGTGKTSCARIFAKSLNCVEGPTPTPCQKCPSCIDITNAAGLDVIEIDAASNRGIQDAKELISQVRYAPINGKYKIYIIDEVHMLSNDAFNALLKTFEEPPENVIFILATTEPHKVLETIVSRCQRFDFRRITVDDITKRLREVSDLENIKITNSALYTIAKNVSGGMRDSLALLDQVSVLGVKEEIDKDLIEDLLGKINFNVLLKLLKDITDENIENSVADVNDIYSKGNEPRNLAENFIEFLRNTVLVLNSASSDKIPDFMTFTDENFKKIQELNFDKDKILKILNTLIEYYKEIKVSANPYLWMELAVIASCKIELSINKISNTNSSSKALQIQQEQIENIHTEPESAAKQQLNSIPSTKKQIQISPKTDKADNKNEAADTISQNQNAAEIWSSVLSNISALPARAFYSGTAKLIKIENKKITLGFIYENTLTQAKMPAKQSALEASLKSLYPDYSLEFIKTDSSVKYIEVKLKSSPVQNSIRINNPKVSQSVYEQPETVPSKNEAPSVEQNIYENQSDNMPNFDDDTEDGKSAKRSYSPKVQDMLEQFGGKIIE